jgi:ABC-2 type transport system permease protein
MNIKRIAILARKDLIDSIRTPRLLLIIITPLVVSLAIGVFFNDNFTLKISLYSPTPTQLTAALREIEFVEILTQDTAEEVQLAIDNNTATVGVILSENFDNVLANSAFPKVIFLLADNSTESQAGLSLVQQTVQLLSPNPSPITSSIEVLQPDIEQGISLRGNLSMDQFAVVMFLVMGLVSNGIMLVPTLVVEERERKTLDALLISPASYSDVAMSKSLIGVIYSIAGGAIVLFVQGGLAGNIMFTLLLLLIGSLALSLLGLLVGSLAENIHALNSYGSLLIFPLTLPAIIGILGPNPYIQYLQFLPTYHLVQGIALAMNGQAEKITPNLIILTIECFVIFGTVVWSLKRRETA